MVTLQDVLAARERIRGIVAVTPCPLSEPFSELCGARIHFKLENLHRTGSFKEGGAGDPRPGPRRRSARRLDRRGRVSRRDGPGDEILEALGAYRRGGVVAPS